MTALKFLGGLLITVGGLIVLLAGGCGAIFVSVVGVSSFREIIDTVQVLAIFSGIPIAIGSLLIMAGRFLVKRKYYPKIESLEEFQTTPELEKRSDQNTTDS